MQGFGMVITCVHFLGANTLPGKMSVAAHQSIVADPGRSNLAQRRGKECIDLGRRGARQASPRDRQSDAALRRLLDKMQQYLNSTSFPGSERQRLDISLLK